MIFAKRIFCVQEDYLPYKKLNLKFLDSCSAMKKLTLLRLCLATALLLLAVACNKDKVTATAPKKNTAEQQSAELINLGNNQWQMGNYQEALKYFTKAYKEVKKTGDEPEMATLLNNLGLVHWRLENNTAAMECYTEAAQLAEKHNLKRLLGLTYTNRALIYKEQRNFKPAFEHNNKAIAIFKELNQPRDLAIAYNNQGQIYRYGKNLDPALTFYKLSLDVCQKIGYKEGIATAYQNLGTVYTLKGDDIKALDAARKCLSISLTLNSKVRISEAYEELAKNHEKFGRADSALYYYKKHSDTKQALLEANQSDLLSRYQANLGMEVKNLRIQNLQNEKQIAANRLWFIAIGIFMLLLIAAFFVYRYLSKIRFNKRQLELELENSKQIIDIREQELKTYIIDLSQKNTIISRLQGDIPEEETTPEATPEVADLLEQKILTDDDWEKFKTRFKAIYPVFFTRIKESGIALTEAEVRVLVLMRLELNSKEMAGILGISPQSVRVCKMRLRKKLPPEKYETVEDFLHYIIR